MTPLGAFPLSPLGAFELTPLAARGGLGIPSNPQIIVEGSGFVNRTDNWAALNTTFTLSRVGNYWQQGTFGATRVVRIPCDAPENASVFTIISSAYGHVYPAAGAWVFAGGLYFPPVGGVFTQFFCSTDGGWMPGNITVLSNGL